MSGSIFVMEPLTNVINFFSAAQRSYLPLPTFVGGYYVDKQPSCDTLLKPFVLSLIFCFNVHELYIICDARLLPGNGILACIQVLMPVLSKDINNPKMKIRHPELLVGNCMSCMQRAVHHELTAGQRR